MERHWNSGEQPSSGKALKRQALPGKSTEKVRSALERLSIALDGEERRRNSIVLHFRARCKDVFLGVLIFFERRKGMKLFYLKRKELIWDNL